MMRIHGNKLIRSTLAATLLLSTALMASEIEGFTEPYLSIDVPAADTGVIDAIDVKEGDAVQAGEQLGHLNHEVLTATLEVADASRSAKGRLQSAQAEVRMQAERLVKLKELLARKHASQEEVERTMVDKEIAEARLLAVEEELLVRDLEYKRIQAQINQRLLKSPIDGVVQEIVKEAGEFVSPNDPVVMSIVQLDPLIAVFAVPGAESKSLSMGNEITIRLGDTETLVQGTIELIAPVIDAQSGTIQVKIRVPNAKGEHRAGERCVLQLGDTKTVANRPGQKFSSKTK